MKPETEKQFCLDKWNLYEDKIEAAIEKGDRREVARCSREAAFWKREYLLRALY